MIENTPDRPAGERSTLAGSASTELSPPQPFPSLSIEQVQLAVLKFTFPRHVSALLGQLRTALEPYRQVNDEADAAWAKVQSEPEFADRAAALRRDSVSLVMRTAEMAEQISATTELSPEVREAVTTLLDDIRFQFSAAEVLGEEISEITIRRVVDSIIAHQQTHESGPASDGDALEMDETAFRKLVLALVCDPNNYAMALPEDFSERFTDCSSALRWVFPAPDPSFSGEFSPAAVIAQLDPDRFACSASGRGETVRGDEDRLRLCIDYLCLAVGQIDKATDDALDTVRFGRLTAFHAVLSEVGSPDAARLASASSGQKRFGICTVEGATVEFDLLVPSILRKRWREEFELRRPGIEGTFRNILEGDEASAEIHYHENVGEAVDSVRLVLRYNDGTERRKWRDSGFHSEEGQAMVENTRKLRPVLAFREFVPGLDPQGAIIAVPVAVVHDVEYRDNLRDMFPKILALAGRLQNARYVWFEPSILFATVSQRQQLGSIVIAENTVPAESGLEPEDPMQTALRTMVTPLQWERSSGQPEIASLRERDETESLVYLGCMPPATASIEITESAIQTSSYEAILAIASKVRIRYLTLGAEGLRALRSNGQSIEDFQAAFFGGLLNALTEIEAQRGSLDGCVLTCGVTEFAGPYGRGNTPWCALTYLFDADDRLVATATFFRGSTRHEISLIDTEIVAELESRLQRAVDEIGAQGSPAGVTVRLGALLEKNGVLIPGAMLMMLGQLAGEMPNNLPYGVTTPALCLRVFIANAGAKLLRQGTVISLEN